MNGKIKKIVSGLVAACFSVSLLFYLGGLETVKAQSEATSSFLSGMEITATATSTYADSVLYTGEFYNLTVQG